MVNLRMDFAVMYLKTLDNVLYAKGRKLNNVTMTIEIDRKERMPTIEKSP